jgi:uncharacterized membrane protein
MVWARWCEGISSCSGAGAGAILGLSLLAAAIGLGIWAIVVFNRRSHKGNGAMAIARERYARGEISREEFDRIKKDLS